MTDDDKNTSKQIVKGDLIELYDEFDNLNEACCFLLDAGSIMRINNRLFNEISVDGYRQCSGALKERLAEFKDRLRSAHENSVVIE